MLWDDWAISLPVSRTGFMLLNFLEGYLSSKRWNFHTSCTVIWGWFIKGKVGLK